MDWLEQETYKSLMTYGQAMLRYVFLVNSGAIIAIMTFVGHSADKTLAGSFKVPVVWFVIGLLSAGLATMTAYTIQFVLYLELGDEPTEQKIPHHMRWWIFSMCLIAFSIICFGIGAIEAMDALS